MFPIAVLQGRLSPSLDGRFQFFPTDWAAEFEIAKSMGLAGIEWLCDTPEMEAGNNPLTNFAGRADIGRIVRATGIPVTSVCTDWYMKYDLRDPGQAKTDWLLTVLDAATHTTDRRVLVPLLEANAPRNDSELAAVRANLMHILPALEKLHVTLAFEMELAVERLLGFVDSFGSPWVGVYYDMGNCTSYGFNCPFDIRVLSHRIKGVHVKDRRRASSQSVPLGAGDADIKGMLEALAVIGWRGNLVLQTWRAEAYLQDIQQQLEYLRSAQKEVFGEAKPV